MTDSTIDNKSGDGSFDLGPSVDELFGDIEDESSSEQVRNEGGDGAPIEDTADDGIEDQTAADVFNQLRDEAPDTDGTDILEDESPDDIIDSADSPADDTSTVDDDLLVDEHALENLLLTGRTKEDEFLWVDDGSSSDADEDETASDEQDPIFGGSDPDSSEQVAEASTAMESDSTTADPIGGDSTGGSASESDRGLESSGIESESEPQSQSPSKSTSDTATDTDTHAKTDVEDTAQSSSSTTSSSSNAGSKTTTQTTSRKTSKKARKAKKSKKTKKTKKTENGKTNSKSEDSSRSLFERLGSKVGRLFS